MIKLEKSRIQQKIGLDGIELVFPQAFHRKEDVYRAGAHTVSKVRASGYVYYFIWDHQLHRQLKPLIFNEEYDAVLDIIRGMEEVRGNDYLWKRIKHFVKAAQRARFPYTRKKNLERLLAIITIIGFLELESYNPGWKAKHIAYAFIRPDQRGKGLGGKMYDAALVAGGEILGAGELQSHFARKVWLSLISNPNYTCWCDNDKGVRRLLELVDPSTLSDKEKLDDNNLVDSPYPLWYPDSKKRKPDPLHVRVFAIARKRTNRYVLKK